MDEPSILQAPTNAQREAWEAECATVTDLMNAHTRPFVTPLVHDVPGEPLRFGGGTYVDVSGGVQPNITLVTCEHVARFQPLLHQPEGSARLLPLAGQLCIDRNVLLDAATTSITQAAWTDTAHVAMPLTLDRFAERHVAVPGEILFFRGLAGENAYVSGDVLDGVYSGYGSQERPGSGDDQIFEIEWNPSGTQTTPGTHPSAASRVKYNDAHGFSGSLVWNTRFVEMHRDFNRWHPSDAIVTGLLRRWDTTSMTLLAWRVEHLRAWLAARPPWA